MRGGGRQSSREREEGREGEKEGGREGGNNGGERRQSEDCRDEGARLKEHEGEEEEEEGEEKNLAGLHRRRELELIKWFHYCPPS